MPIVKRCLTLAAAIFISAPAISQAIAEKSNIAQSKVQGSPQQQRDIAPDPARPLVVGGTDAADGVHPFQVGLVFKNISDDYQAQFCGGTLVAERFVVTAAHCTTDIEDFDNPGSEVQVLVGARRLDGSGQRVDVARVQVHPDYDELSIDYDVAVWELATPVSGIRFARLADMPPSKSRTPLRLTGWGQPSESPKLRPPVALQQVDLPFVRTVAGSCEDLEYEITPRMICAGGSGVSSCYGDSGGPLTINRGTGYDELVGIVSWGEVCAGRRLPAVFTNVADSSINRFIRSIVFEAPYTIEFQNAALSVREAARKLNVTVTRSIAAGGAAVRFETVGGTAIAGADFRAASGTLTFAPGSRTATASINILNDRLKESPEIFSIVLSQPSSGWSIGNGTLSITINDND